MHKKCINGKVEPVWLINNKPVCTGTHPDKPNYSGHSRGRKIHLAKNDEKTICNLLVDGYIPKSDKNWTTVHNGKCKICFK